jgi:hypothetical protein
VTVNERLAKSQNKRPYLFITQSNSTKMARTNGYQAIQAIRRLLKKRSQDGAPLIHRSWGPTIFALTTPAPFAIAGEPVGRAGEGARLRSKADDVLTVLACVCGSPFRALRAGEGFPARASRKSKGRALNLQRLCRPSLCCGPLGADPA